MIIKKKVKIDIIFLQMDFAFNLSETKVNVLNDKIFCLNMHVEPCPDYFDDEMKEMQVKSEQTSVGPMMKIPEFKEDQHENASYRIARAFG